MQANIFVSDLFYFPSVHWYANALVNHSVALPHAKYNKSYHLNKTTLLSANGKINLSIPLLGGREQRLPDNEIAISYAEPWQQNHLKSLKSMYGRAPFFENVFPYLENFYTAKFKTLYDCNLHSVLLVNKILGILLNVESTIDYPVYKQMHAKDIPYNQVFASKYGFVENLSILDLLMNEGRYTLQILNQMK